MLLILNSLWPIQYCLCPRATFAAVSTSLVHWHNVLVPCASSLFHKWPPVVLVFRDRYWFYTRTTLCFPNSQPMVLEVLPPFLRVTMDYLRYMVVLHSKSYREPHLENIHHYVHQIGIVRLVLVLET